MFLIGRVNSPPTGAPVSLKMPTPSALIERLIHDRTEWHSVLDLIHRRTNRRRGSLFAVADQAILDRPGQQ